MPKIIVGINIPEDKDIEQEADKVIDETEKTAKIVFGPIELGGILPILIPGATEVIPAFGSFEENELYPGGEVHILLHQKEERTEEILNKIEDEFYQLFENLGFTKILVLVNDLPEKLWRKI